MSVEGRQGVVFCSVKIKNHFGCIITNGYNNKKYSLVLKLKLQEGLVQTSSANLVKELGCQFNVLIKFYVHTRLFPPYGIYILDFLGILCTAAWFQDQSVLPRR